MHMPTKPALNRGKQTDPKNSPAGMPQFQLMRDPGEAIGKRERGRQPSVHVCFCVHVCFYLCLCVYVSVCVHGYMCDVNQFNNFKTKMSEYIRTHYK